VGTLKINIAGAPISWGVCEVPNWGHQMEPSRVLREMSELGLGATEFGPDGFLPMQPELKASILKEHNMTAVGGFVPVILHRADHDPVPAVKKELESYKAAGAKVLVLAANSGIDGYDAKLPVLSDADWQILFNNLNRLQQAAAEVGVKAVLHPHVGTMIETQDHVMRVVAGSTIPFCLDTGHMIIGGTDPVAFAQNHAERVAHSHLKDVDLSWAKKVQSNELSYYDAVVQGMYRPLGQGDVDIRTIVRSLIKSGYTGWFVLEQDNVITAEPGVNQGPVADAKASVEFLRGVIAELEAELAS
jgi:inosose dehydratase